MVPWVEAEATEELQEKQNIFRASFIREDVDSIDITNSKKIKDTEKEEERPITSKDWLSVSYPNNCGFYSKSAIFSSSLKNKWIPKETEFNVNQTER